MRAPSRGTLRPLGIARRCTAQETILYAGCRATLATGVTLVPGARFIGWEVLCLGRPAAAERFDAGVCRLQESGS